MVRKLRESELSSFERMQDVYGINKKQYDLWVTIMNNLNTKKGYDTYYELEKEFTNNDGTMKEGEEEKVSILADTAASFNWDDELTVECLKRALDDRRFEYVYTSIRNMLDY